MLEPTYDHIKELYNNLYKELTVSHGEPLTATVSLHSFNQVQEFLEKIITNKIHCINANLDDYYNPNGYP